MGSSSIRRARALLILPSSPFLATVTAMNRLGFGKTGAGSLTTREGSQRVSPVFALTSFATAPMSPAPMLSASVCFLPRTVRGLPIFSVSPVRALTREAPAVILPLTTRR